MFGIGQGEMLVLLVIVLLIFGPKNLPRLAKSLGSSVRELKRGVQGLGEDLDETVHKPETRSDRQQDEKPATKQSDAKPVEKSGDDLQD